MTVQLSLIQVLNNIILKLIIFKQCKIKHED